MNTSNTKLIDPEMCSEILSQLSKIERDHNITILYACESGSRAWGFESPDSDYDVRFIYVEKPDWFIQIEDKRDVIERPINKLLDISGWNLKKTLGLLRKSNPALLEWLRSPIVYGTTAGIEDLRALAAGYYDETAAIYHYRSMAKNTYHTHLLKEEPTYKKYFYAIRPLLAVEWIQKGLGVPPVEFSKLLAVNDNPRLQKEVAELLVLKSKADEVAADPANQFLLGWIEVKLADPHIPRIARNTAVGPLNEYLRKSVQHYSNHEFQLFPQSLYGEVE